MAAHGQMKELLHAAHAQGAHTLEPGLRRVTTVMQASTQLAEPPAATAAPAEHIPTAALTTARWTMVIPTQIAVSDRSECGSSDRRLAGD